MIDYARDENYDLVIQDGDFVRTEATADHQKSLILDVPGDYKDNPLVGVGIVNYINDEGPQNLIRAISQQFMKDGMEVVSVTLGNDGVIHSDAYYK